jgi:hypothetical protein
MKMIIKAIKKLMTEEMVETILGMILLWITVIISLFVMHIFR